MKKQIDHWFPTLVYRTILDEFQEQNEYLERKAYSLKFSRPVVSTQWNCDTYNTLDLYNPTSDRDSIVNGLIDLCRDRVYDFSKEFGISKNIEQLVCTDFWFNIAQPGNYQECHQHPNSHFSLVYYIKVSDNCGNIVFKSPTAFSDMFPLSINSKNLNKNSYPACWYTPEESVLLIFRSNLVHMVEKNLSSTDRISVSMNFKFKD
jgi:uncharacterized protein (TIGR02466 family)